MDNVTLWGAEDAARFITVPLTSDDKYSRGVVGFITGSRQYPGAAVLGVEAALRTGVGMVRYLGPEVAGSLVLQRRPEAVLSAGRVQAWVIGSGIDHVSNDEKTDSRIAEAMADSVPTVLDGGSFSALELARAPVVITPHYRELGRLLDVTATVIAENPRQWAQTAATRFGVTVLLKGNRTVVSDGVSTLVVAAAPTWLATAGAGDALAGILGSLLATHSDAVSDAPGLLVELSATASYLHGRAAERASDGGPLTVLDLCKQIPAVISVLVGGDEHTDS